MVVPMSQASHGEKENRFAYLLHPIRDLAKNWNVDIAQELEEFLDEVERITVSFDGGSTTMNFAEAALLVQGSACVYSKKVEYLYSLTYQVLDLVRSKKKMKQVASVDGQGNDKDTTFGNHEEKEDFLSLDDLQEHRNTDLKNVDGKNVIQDLPHTPMVLVKLDADVKGENSLLSRKGEVLGNKNDFKMNTSNLHVTGTMMLDLTHLALLEASMKHQFTTPQTILEEHETMDRSDAVDLIKGMPEVEPMELQNDSACGDDIGGVFDDMDGVAPDLPPADVTAVQQPPKEEVEQTVRRSERQRKQVMLFEPKQPPKIVRDPWETQNPHEDVAHEKKFKKTKTFKVPPELAPNPGQRKRKKNPPAAEVEKKLQPLGNFIANAFFSHSSKFPSNPLKVPSFPEFENLYWAEYKKRQTVHRKEAKILAQQGRFEELEDQEEEENIPPQADPGEVAPDDDDDNSSTGLPADPFPENFDMGGAGDGPQDYDMAGMGLEYPATQDSSVVQTYEDLVRRHVESYLAGAQQYAQITELSRRVSDWEEKIIPKLDQEEVNGTFDIHRYGSTVLDSFCIEEDDSPSEIRVPFKYVTKGKQQFEICRLFAATLQLANNYNVEISTDGSLEKGVDTMALKLLSKRRHHEELQEYRAPSINS